MHHLDPTIGWQTLTNRTSWAESGFLRLTGMYFDIGAAQVSLYEPGAGFVPVDQASAAPGLEGRPRV